MIAQPERSLLILSNVQDDLVPILHEGDRVVERCCWLAGLARELRVPTLVMEHKRLGATMPALRELTAGSAYEEIVTFSYFGNPKSRARIEEFSRDQIILAGTETHISIFQTACDIVSAGLHALVIGEACSTRDRDDHEEALPRLRQVGAQVLTREMLFFEWVGSSEHPRYRELSLQYVKHPTPPPPGVAAGAQ